MLRGHAQRYKRNDRVAQALFTPELINVDLSRFDAATLIAFTAPKKLIMDGRSLVYILDTR